ncbi:MAG: hypothetical protein AB1505_32320 [Candidatus Latescibacterota bacterium]
MKWWIITVVCICGALLIQYLCSSKLLRMKQAISLKTMSLRDAREEGERLDEQEVELKSQQTGLTHSIERLHRDIRRLRDDLEHRGVEVPEPDFPLAESEPEGEDSEPQEA